MFLDTKTDKKSTKLHDLSRGKELDQRSLTDFLAFGYVPGSRTLFEGIEYLPSGITKNCTKEKISSFITRPHNQQDRDLIKYGINTWEKVVSKLLQQNEDTIVVPLSGGLDSRAILGELLKHFDAKKIHTYTFGTPGTLDYDIGRSVAAHVGTTHISYDLTKYKFTQKRLERIAYLSNGNTDLFTHTPVDYIIRDIGLDGTSFWVGFMGDPSVGSHIPNATLLSKWGKGYCLEKERNSTGTHLEKDITGFLHSPANIDLPKLPQETEVYAEELWDFENRQLRYVAPQVLLNNFNYLLPFVQEEWLRFALNLPLEYRNNQKFYKQMLCEAYPDLFSLPVKNNFGLPLSASKVNVAAVRVGNKLQSILRDSYKNSSFNPNTNYINFEHAIRERHDVQNVVKENIDSLCNRISVDTNFINSLWQGHRSKRNNFATALTLLASLEIIFRVFKD